MSQKQNDLHRYDDIIHLSHHVSKLRKKMSNLERAAQFAPFAALSGHEEAIAETARRCEVKRILDESELAILDMKLQILHEHIQLAMPVEITFFKPDKYKKGGQYLRITAVIKRIDLIENQLILTDQTQIKINDIYDLQGTVFEKYMD